LAVIQKEYSGVLGNITARSIIHAGPLVKYDDPDTLDLILKEYNKIIKKKAMIALSV
jgi:lipid II:glycine glycyltransferase (peptidoglycan interpeptide bridge formation enzyme)